MGTKSWVVTDEFWSQVGPLIQVKPERATDIPFIRKPGEGRKPKPERVVFEAIVFVLRTGCLSGRCYLLHHTGHNSQALQHMS